MRPRSAWLVRTRARYSQRAASRFDGLGLDPGSELAALFKRLAAHIRKIDLALAHRDQHPVRTQEVVAQQDVDVASLAVDHADVGVLDDFFADLEGLEGRIFPTVT